MTKKEKETIEVIVWNILKNCRYYREKGCENCLKYEIGRLAGTIHIMIEMGMPIREIIKASDEFIKIQIDEKSKEGF